MRKGWEYKRFDEVFDLQMGKTPDRKNPEYFGGNNVWVSIRDLGDKEIADSNEHITDLAVSNSNIRKVKKGTVIMSFKLTVGKCGIAATDLYTNEAIMAFNTKESFDINSSFLYYYLLCYHWVGSNKAVMGITLNKATISKQYISIPPKSTQLSIVSELDKINELIRLKKEQLKDFDNLAQSLFYEMFGDPVENEKGWEVKKLGEVGELARGVSKHRPRNAPELLGGSMPLIQTGDVANSDFYITKYSSTYSKLGVEQSRVWEAGTLCITIAATIGKCAILGFTACFPDSVVGYKPNNEANAIYMYFIFKNMQKMLEEFAPGVAQKNINLKILSNLSLPLPPLSLQRLFAQRIEQIEREKTEVQKSIQDLETLLASRMQYWFE